MSFMRTHTLCMIIVSKGMGTITLTASFVISVRLSVRMKQICSRRMDFNEI